MTDNSPKFGKQIELSTSPLYIVSALLLILLTGGTSSIHAQWHGDGTQMSEASVLYEPLSTLPEYHTDMPLDCMVAYIVMDSVARTISDHAMIRSYPGSTSLDTLKVLSRFLFAAQDYDPILLQRFILHSNDYVRDSLSQYATYPVYLHTGVVDALWGAYQQFGLDNMLLLRSGYILKVRVTEVRQGIDTTLGNPKPWANVACEVLETIKGQHLPQNCYWNENPSGNGTSQVAPEPNPCFIYGYDPGMAVGGFPHDSPARQFKGRIVEPANGDVLYVFLDVVHTVDGLLTIYPQTAYDATGGIFRVVNGNVQDTGNVFGLGVSPDETAFRQHMLDKIATIQSWWISP